MGEIERRDHLVDRKEFLIAVAPAETDEIIAQRRRQIAHRAIGVDAERAMPFSTVSRRQRRGWSGDMRHARHVPAERLIDLHLPAALVR